MVKVLKCHNFKAQSIVPVENEPIKVHASGNLVFVATQECTVEVFSLSSDKNKLEKCIRLHCFPTEAQVLQLLYNKTGNYVCTLECKKARRAEFYSVRVYLNWDRLKPGKNKQERTRVRLAGRSHSVKSSNTTGTNQLEVVEIPYAGIATSIATCQETGNLALVSDCTVQMYHLVEKTIVNTEHTYLDVVMFLRCTWKFPVHQIYLCEDYLASLSEGEIQVVRFTYSDTTPKSAGQSMEEGEKQTRRSTSVDSIHSRRVPSTGISQAFRNNFRTSSSRTSVTSGSQPVSLLLETRSSTTSSPAFSSRSLSLTKSVNAVSCITDDQYFCQWNFDDRETRLEVMTSSIGSFPETRRHKQLSKPLPKTVTLKGLQGLPSTDQTAVDLPTVEDLRDSGATGGGAHSTIGEVTVATVLHRRCEPATQTWKHLQLIPTYLSHGHGLSFQDMSSSVPLHSASYSGLVGMSCLVSGAQVGYMYALCPQASLLSTYKYTAEAIKVVGTGNLLHVLTRTGLETYTARCHAAAIHNTQHFNNVTKAFPPADLDICLCGIQPFIGPQDISVTDVHVTLLSKLSEKNSPDGTVWSLYCLDSAAATEMYRDIQAIAYGSKYQETGPNTYLLLLQEGHMLLKSHLIGCQLDSEVAQEFIQESCALLGEYYAMPDCEDWELCLPYYTMSGLGVVDIVRQAVQYKQHSRKPAPSCYGRGLLHFLNHVLFLDDDPLDVKEAEGDMIVEVIAESSPEKLSCLVLFSRLKTYSSEKMLSYLQAWMKGKPADSKKSALDLLVAALSQKQGAPESALDLLAVVVLHVQMCDLDAAHQVLTAIKQHELTEICTNHNQLLHQDFLELSPLSQLMRRHCPAVLIQSMVNLHDTGTIPLDLAIKLLQGQTAAGEIHRNVHVKEYLESLLNNASRKYIFDDAGVILCDIYIQRLSEWRAPYTRLFSNPVNFQLPKGNGHFGRRHIWLDQLPPFYGSPFLHKPCQYQSTASPNPARRPSLLTVSSRSGQSPASTKDACPCCWCNEDLLKLQSLLCSQHMTDSFVNCTLSLMDKHKTIHGYDSIWLLCMVKHDIGQATRTMVDKYPATLTEFGIVSLGTDTDKWQHLVQTLTRALRIQADSPDEQETTYVMALKGVLTHLASFLTPADFLRLLPEDGSFLFFLPFLDLCFHKQQLHKLKLQIISKGDRLKSLS